MDLMNRLLNNEVERNELYYGKTGEVLLLYLLFLKTEDIRLQNRAVNNLNEISENIAFVEDLGFAEGLAGIGWAIEWVAQNNLLEIDTNEVLEDVDSILYKSVIFSSDNNISLYNGTLGKFLYFLSRYRSKNPNTIRLKNIFHEECLILLTDDLYEKTHGDYGLFHKENLTGEDLVNLGHLIYFISDFLWLKLNEPTVESLLYDSIGFINNLCERKQGLSLEESQVPYYKFLTTCYYLTGKNHRSTSWKDQAVDFYKMFINKGSCEDGNLNSLYNFFYLGVFNESYSPLSEIKMNQEKILLGNKNGKLILWEMMTQQHKNNNSKEILELFLMLDSDHLI